MSAPAFTPGPWSQFCVKPKADRFVTIGVRGKFGAERLIAEMLWDNTIPQSVADASLIAASPTLYGALEAFPDAAHHADPFSWLAAVGDWQLRHCAPALAKARGEA